MSLPVKKIFYNLQKFPKLLTSTYPKKTNHQSILANSKNSYSVKMVEMKNVLASTRYLSSVFLAKDVSQLGHFRMLKKLSNMRVYVRHRTRKSALNYPFCVRWAGEIENIFILPPSIHSQSLGKLLRRRYSEK